MYRDSMLNYQIQIQNLTKKTQEGFDVVANGLEQLEREVNLVKEAIDYRYNWQPYCAIHGIRDEISWMHGVLDQLTHEQSNNLAKKRRKVTICAHGKTIEVKRV